MVLCIKLLAAYFALEGRLVRYLVREAFQMFFHGSKIIECTLIIILYHCDAILFKNWLYL